MCEIETTINAYLDDETTPEQIAELEAWLRQSKANRETFVRATHLHRTLRDMTFGQNAHSAISPLADETEISVKSKPNIRGVLIGLAATALVLLAGQQLVSRLISMYAEIGTVAKANNCAWEDPNFDLARALTGGSKLNLISGVAEIKLANGVRVVMQDNTSLEFDSESRARLHEGTVSVFVPKNAIGFQVIAPAVTVTDMGTEFGVMSVNAARTEVHVFKGSVKIETKIGPKTRQAIQRANQAAIIDYKTRDWQQGLVRPEYFAGRLKAVESKICYSNSSNVISVEAESHSSRSGFGELKDVWQEQPADSTSSNGYMQTLIGGFATNARYNQINQFGSAWIAYDFEVSEAGGYQFWVRGKAANNQNNHTLVELLESNSHSGNNIRLVPTTASAVHEVGDASAFSWKAVQWENSRTNVSLNAGRYRLRFFTRHVGPMIDKIVIQPAQFPTPEGTGPPSSDTTN